MAESGRASPCGVGAAAASISVTAHMETCVQTASVFRVYWDSVVMLRWLDWVVIL